MLVDVLVVATVSVVLVEDEGGDIIPNGCNSARTTAAVAPPNTKCDISMQDRIFAPRMIFPPPLVSKNPKRAILHHD